MKKLITMIMAVAMVFTFAAGASASEQLTKEDAKMIALEKAGVTKHKATFTKEHRDFDDGREEFEFEFFADGVEFDIDVDAATGRIVKYDTEPCCREDRNFDDRDFEYDDSLDRDDVFDFLDLFD